MFFLSMSCMYALDAKQEEIFSDQMLELFTDPVFEKYMHSDMHMKQIRFHDNLADNFADRASMRTEHQKQKSRIFYDQYLSKYYPKVFVIRECFFENMTPKQIAQALSDIVMVFSEETWFYFVDKAKDFKITHYWEYVVDQCSLISEFLTKARVDLDTLNVSYPEECDDDYNRHYLDGFAMNKPGSQNMKSKNLFSYLCDTSHTIVYDFYALCFDYVIKLFNEGINLKEVAPVQKYLYELEFIMGKLRKSSYEEQYQESVKTCKELIVLLKNKCGVDDTQTIDDLCGDDDQMRRMLKESYELNGDMF